MLLECVRFVLCVSLIHYCPVNLVQGQYLFRDFEDITNSVTTPLPFPPCHADNVECLRRGLRTFFFLMDEGFQGMKPMDPITLDSVALSFPDHQLSMLMRRVNVTGARWTRLVDRQFNLPGLRSGVRFKSDLHVIGELIMTKADVMEPFTAIITMDIEQVESNITYGWRGERRYDSEDYLIMGQERIAVRNTHLPTYFLQPDGVDSITIEEAIRERPAILDHMSNEVVAALMRTVVDNFRLFASKIPIKHYYKYY